MLPALWHRYIFLFGIVGLAAGMMFGTVPTSIPQIILGANWLLELDYNRKWQQLKSSHHGVFWILFSLFLLHVMGMLYTQNIPKGLDDLRNKIPLLILPLMLFSTKPLSTKELKLLFGTFFVSVFVSSICCFFVYVGFTKKIIVDVRKASIFMSHIRFSLFISFAIIGLIYATLTEKNKLLKIICVLVTLWLLFFMYKLEMATGFLLLIVVGLLLVVLYVFNWISKAASLILLVVLSIIGIFIVNKAMLSLSMFEKTNNNPANVILEKTKNGNFYYNDTASSFSENGNLIIININDLELQKEWNKKSKIPYNGKDNKGNELCYTLKRYIASKGFTKDSLGFSKLNIDDIKRIENGITNYKYNVNSGLSSKWREFVWEYTKYKKGENPSGHSLIMRLEFWKNASYIIYENPLFGVGTGDIQDSFDAMYTFTNSKLDMIWRLRCHNQYLAITVAFGFFGLILFLFYLIYPAIILRKKLHYLYWPFYLIALLSFVTEDTLETQSGVTFFIFFQTLFLWLASAQYQNNINKKEL
jgi:hypothetical protein